MHKSIIPRIKTAKNVRNRSSDMLGHCQAYELHVYGLQAYKTKKNEKRRLKMRREQK